MALTWRPFRLLFASASRSLGLYAAGPLAVIAFFKNLSRTLRLVAKDSASYLKAMVILLWTASVLNSRLSRSSRPKTVPTAISSSRDRLTSIPTKPTACLGRKGAGEGKGSESAPSDLKVVIH